METEKEKCAQKGHNVTIGEAQLLLAEKRTAFAALRTGIAVFALPLSVSSFLIVFSNHYQFAALWEFFVPIIAVCTILAVLGIYLIVKSCFRIITYDRLVAKLKEHHNFLGEFMD